MITYAYLISSQCHRAQGYLIPYVDIIRRDRSVSKGGFISNSDYSVSRIVGLQGLVSYGYAKPNALCGL